MRARREGERKSDNVLRQNEEYVVCERVRNCVKSLRRLEWQFTADHVRLPANMPLQYLKAFGTVRSIYVACPHQKVGRLTLPPSQGNAARAEPQHGRVACVRTSMLPANMPLQYLKAFGTVRSIYVAFPHQKVGRLTLPPSQGNVARAEPQHGRVAWVRTSICATVLLCRNKYEDVYACRSLALYKNVGVSIHSNSFVEAL